MALQTATIKASEATNGDKSVGAAKSETLLAASPYRLGLYVAASGLHDAWLWFSSGAEAEKAEELKGLYLKAGNPATYIGDWNGAILVYAKEATTVSYVETHSLDPAKHDEEFKTEAPKPPAVGEGFSKEPSSSPGAGQ